MMRYHCRSMSYLIQPTVALVLIWSIAFGGLSRCRADDPVEISVWPGVAPGSEDIDEQEKVVDRGEGKGYVDRSISDVHRPTLTVHLPADESGDGKTAGDNSKSDKAPPRPAIVICPGGGLSRVVIDKEGHDFARFLNEQGIVAFVLKFRTAQTTTHHYGIAAPLADALRSIRLVRAHADKWNVDRNKVGLFGFSAGGYLAAAAATHFEPGKPQASDPLLRVSSRPDFLGLAYPLISLQPDVTKANYRELLLGKKPTPAQIEQYSSELQVSDQTPVTFLCHAKDDSGVPVLNSLRFAAACEKAGVECTSFIHEKGGHGFGIREMGHPINKWRFAFVEWLKKQKIVQPR